MYWCKSTLVLRSEPRRLFQLLRVILGSIIRCCSSKRARALPRFSWMNTIAETDRYIQPILQMTVNFCWDDYSTRPLQVTVDWLSTNFAKLLIRFPFPHPQVQCWILHVPNAQTNAQSSTLKQEGGVGGWRQGKTQQSSNENWQESLVSKSTNVSALFFRRMPAFTHICKKF